MKIREFALNYISLFLLLALTASSLIADWKLDPIWNILYARVQSNLFYNAHASSILAICFLGFYLAFRKKDGLPTGVFAAFSVAAIHELSLDFSDLVVFHQSSGISPMYGAYLFGFLIAGIYLGKRYHRRVFLVTTIIMVSWFLILTSLPHGTTISPDCPFCPSDDFYTWWVNLEEVGSWLLPVGLWLLPRRWFSRQG